MYKIGYAGVLCFYGTVEAAVQYAKMHLSSALNTLGAAGAGNSYNHAKA